MRKKQTRKRRFLNRLKKVGVSVLTLSLMTSSASAVDPAEAIASKENRLVTKKAFSTALKVAKSKLLIAVVNTLVRASCVSAAGECVSISVYVACEIFFAKIVS